MDSLLHSSRRSESPSSTLLIYESSLFSLILNEKAYSPIVVMLDGKLIEDRLVQ